MTLRRAWIAMLLLIAALLVGGVFILVESMIADLQMQAALHGREIPFWTLALPRIGCLLYGVIVVGFTISIWLPAGRRTP